MKIELNEREVDLLVKILEEKGKELRKTEEYYQNDKVQAESFEINILSEKLISHLNGLTVQ